MLVVTRKPGESVHIGTDIEVTVLSVDNDQIRIGIQAPREIAVHRHEVFQAIVHQNELAAQSEVPDSALLLKLKKPSTPSA